MNDPQHTYPQVLVEFNDTGLNTNFGYLRVVQARASDFSEVTIERRTLDSMGNESWHRLDAGDTNKLMGRALVALGRKLRSAQTELRRLKKL